MRYKKRLISITIRLSRLVIRRMKLIKTWWS